MTEGEGRREKERYTGGKREANECMEERKKSNRERE